MIDLESDLEELHDSEQRWAAKHKRAIEQVNTQETGSELAQTVLSLTAVVLSGNVRLVCVSNENAHKHNQ